MADEDVRWKQRFVNFRSSVADLREALGTEEPNKLERLGIIRIFELCYELAWKTLKDYLREIGYVDVAGPKAVIRHAFEAGLISDGELWAQMHRARSG
jgi:nucleotidyltransferase substrate binding protein (TIGR01987 family)